jgi:predicted RecB family nuclease
MKYAGSQLVYSPTDLIRYLASPFASWMDRYHFENPSAALPDQPTDDQRLIAQTGNQHEQDTLVGFRASTPGLVEIGGVGFEEAERRGLSAVHAKAPVIYQAALKDDRFAGFADFLILDDAGRYQVWDAKLARSPKPYFAIQLCCYSEMFAASTEEPLPTKFGVILGTGDRVALNVEDFVYYYRRVRHGFLALQDRFTGRLDDRPEPLPRADHGLWTSHADEFFDSKDHLVRVANITVGQIKKLKAAGIATVCELAASSGRSVHKLAASTLETLAAQARLQSQTRADRLANPEALARYEVLPNDGDHGVRGLAALQPEDRADVFFDMEGFPLLPGGLEYLFGACSFPQEGESLEFHDWWADDRSEEKVAFESFVDWVFPRWLQNQGMHIYHYAAYEVSALRRLSTQHDTRQDEVDELLRNRVFVDLYQIVCHGLRIGEVSYSIKKVERLYRGGRSTEVATAADSIVRYAQWMVSEQPRDWRESNILREIRDYNQDDCISTAELAQWLRSVAAANGIQSAFSIAASASAVEPKVLTPEVIARLELAARLHEREDAVSQVLGDLIGFHRREDKPLWWKMFDREQAPAEELRDDPSCVQGITAVGSPRIRKQSLIQTYQFDPSQECKLRADEESKVMFCGALKTKFTLVAINHDSGQLQLKMSRRSLIAKCGGVFPTSGSILPDEFVSKEPISASFGRGC